MYYVLRFYCTDKREITLKTNLTQDVRIQKCCNYENKGELFEFPERDPH